MHPTEVDEGVTLTGRYRVTELLAEAPGDEGIVAQTWRAMDEVLSRSVVVYLLAAQDPRSGPVLEASRRAATISDVRFLRVLDALEEDGLAFVVREWVDGRTLATLLAESALPPRDAGLVVREVADALARAHGQELYHQRLDPDSVIITDGGTVKIVGLATHAALNGGGAPAGPSVAAGDSGAGDSGAGDSGAGDSGEPADPGDPATDPERPAGGPDPERVDTLGLGRMLYAALTGRWPTGPRSGLQGGPRASDGTLLSPRQCRAGVPRALDEITERILSDRPRHGTPLSTPQEIVDALTGTVGSTPPEGVLASMRPPATGQNFVAASPPPAATPRTDQTATFDPVSAGSPGYGPQGYGPQGYAGAGAAAGGYGGGAYERSGGPGQPGPGGYPPPGQQPPGQPPARPMAGYREPRQGQGRWQRLAGVLVAVVLLAGIGILAWQLVGQSVSGGGNANQGADESQDDGQQASDEQKKQPPKPAEIVAAGDFDPQGDGEEHPEEVSLTYDGDESTAWRTMSYYDGAEYGSLKEGVGVWLDLGEATKVRQIELLFFGPGPTSATIFAAPKDANEPPQDVDGWTQVGEITGAGEQKETVEPKEPANTRFVLVYLTEIPPEGGNWRGGIAEAVIKS